MSSPESTLRYLYGLQKFGMKLGLKNIQALLLSLGSPELQFASVHVAGTNGKGSTSSMIAAMLTAAGYRVGLYTSPHLVKFNERIRINGRVISNKDLARYTNIVRPKVNKLKATFFEATTAIAFKYFADNSIDIAVVETGLGGRLDATNVITPLLSVITTIGKDHTEQLGTSLKSIAFEKGGIIKRNVPCLTGAEAKSALHELKRLAKGKKASFFSVNTISKVLKWPNDSHRYVWSLKIFGQIYRNLFIPLGGSYQIHNARIAIAAIQKLAVSGFPVPEWAVRDGLENVQKYSGLRGRFEMVMKTPRVIIDVANNPDGVAKTIEALGEIRYSRLKLVFGVMKDKDYRSMIGALSRMHPVVYAVAPKMERALPSKLIAKTFARLGNQAVAFPSVKSGIETALANLSPRDLVLVTGSHYVAGEAFRHFKNGEYENNS